MSNPNDVRDIYVENDFFWSAYSQGIAFNDTKLDNSFGYVDGQMVYSIFDSGSSGILLSSDYYESIVNKLFQEYLKTQNYVIKDGGDQPNVVPSTASIWCRARIIRPR